jgi:hypothetical protein
MRAIRIIIGVVAISLISTGSIFAAMSTVSAPLDGGLLSILGAAGISYYLVRKKKKSSGKI